MFVLPASESKWAGLITLGKVFWVIFWIWEQNKKSCKTLTKFRKEKWESLGCVVRFLLVWEKTSLVCSLLEADRAAEVHWASTAQRAWQLAGSCGIYHCEINRKQDKLHRAPGLQEVENRRFLYHQCGETQTSEEVKEMETIWPTSLCRWYCGEKMISHKIGFGPWEKMLNNKTHDHRHFSFMKINYYQILHRFLGSYVLVSRKITISHYWTFCGKGWFCRVKVAILRLLIWILQVRSSVFSLENRKVILIFIFVPV